MEDGGGIVTWISQVVTYFSCRSGQNNPNDFTNSDPIAARHCVTACLLFRLIALVPSRHYLGGLFAAATPASFAVVPHLLLLIAVLLPISQSRNCSKVAFSLSIECQILLNF